MADLLDAASPDVVVLATSRAPLGLVGEAVHHLRMLPDDDALGLLESRARAGGAGLAWDHERALQLSRQALRRLRHELERSGVAEAN